MGRKATQVEGSGQMIQSRVTEAPWICCVPGATYSRTPMEDRVCRDWHLQGDQ